MTLITDEARAWADREYPDVDFHVDSRDIAKYARAIGAEDPIHYDRDAATAAGYRDVVAPAMFPYVIRMQAYNLVGPEELKPDGSPAGDVPPLPTTRAMAGETSIELGVPVVAGDVVTVAKKLVDMYEKEGRSGPLAFVDMEFTFTNGDGELVASERFTRIYR